MNDNGRGQEQGPRVSHEDEDDPLCSAQAEASPLPFDHDDKLPAVVAYIERDGKLLSISRKDTGERAVPGGKCESGEPPLQALIREVREEAGVRIVGATKVYCGRHTSGQLVIAYRCTIEGEPYAVEEGTRAEWVAPEQIANGFGAEYHRLALVAAGYLPEQDPQAEAPQATYPAVVHRLAMIYAEAHETPIKPGQVPHYNGLAAVRDAVTTELAEAALAEVARLKVERST